MIDRGGDRLAFLERRLSRRKALQYGAAGAAATVATLYASPMIRTVRADGLSGGATLVPQGTDTAFGFHVIPNSHSRCFQLDSFPQWGWTTYFTDISETQNFVMRAGASNCEGGTDVGTATVSWSDDNNGGEVTVEFTDLPGFDMDDFHIWVGQAKYPEDNDGEDTVAPGHYSAQGPRAGESTTFTIPFPEPDFWIILHAGEVTPPVA